MRLAITETPAFRGVNRHHARFDQLDAKRQVSVLLDTLGGGHAFRQKAAGHSTKKKRAYFCYQVLDQIKAAGFAIKSLLNLDQRHIQALVNTWLTEDLKPATLQSKLSNLRWMLACLGKPGMLKAPAFYGIEPSRLKRQYVCTQDKSWSTRGAVPSEVIAKVQSMDEHVGVQLQMMLAFGLRVTEALLMRPRSSHNGDSLVVEEGTKGGRSRVVKIRTDEQRQILEKAKELSVNGSRGTLIKTGLDPAQARRRLYYVCERLGITKSQMTITPHGLRHQYANDLYQEIAGVPTVTRGASVILRNAADRLARQAVTLDLGHKRLSITAAYTGSRRSILTPDQLAKAAEVIIRGRPRDEYED